MDNPRSAPKDWSADLKKSLKLLIEVFEKMRVQRFKTEKFLNLDIPEIRVCCDEEKQEITGIERKIQGPSDQLVEECMLAANSAVASELIAKGIAGLFRVHPEPDPEKIAEFSSLMAQSLHFHTGDILSSRDACIHFLESIPDDHRKPLILSNFLRSLPRAGYSVDPAIHYGLGKVQYSHFTSPIRRYADLTVHQQLWQADTNGRLRSKKSLKPIAEDLSDKEERNDNAYFAAVDRLKIHYLKQHGVMEDGTMYEGVITKITSSGLVCDIAELGLYGFVPMEKIRGGAFRRTKSKHKMKASNSHTEYKIGDFVYLMLDSVDTVRGTAIFRPAL